MLFIFTVLILKILCKNKKNGLVTKKECSPLKKPNLYPETGFSLYPKIRYFDTGYRVPVPETSYTGYGFSSNTRTRTRLLSILEKTIPGHSHP
ncbi:hypothetical protein HanXRQr2_Chr06g0246051 [Helianthus annuus]|uniref:Uncharacterized protein n=1 Tax=Helianthus annuus TaxID=4232 RepID=A0A9K3IQU4_HELAN|nr:hypothetical protein HanXRQr2_Chr06g0246051 [Helianthus annuus]